MTHRRYGVEPGLSALAFFEHGHLLLAEFGQVGRDRVIDTHQPALVERERGHRRERLGHRGNAEDSVGRHLGAGVFVEVPKGAVVDELAAPCHRHHCARQAATLDVGQQHLVEIGKACGRHADGFGLGAGQRIGGLHNTNDSEQRER